MIADQIRLVLPDLAVEVAKRVLAGFTPPPEVVAQLCQQALVALFPEVQNLELVVGERDHEIIASLVPEWKVTYPGISVTVDPAFASGECQVRSRFGVIDARHGARWKPCGGSSRVNEPRRGRHRFFGARSGATGSDL